MKSTDAPSKQAVPFGTNGPREAITATTPSGSNQASYDQGFPPITMTLKSAGGLPPKGQDMNQILFEQSSFNRYFAAGGGYVYDSTFSNAIGGYPSGAIIPFSDNSGYWLNTSENNAINPENTTASLTGWVPVISYGLYSISGLSGSSVVVGTLNASRKRILLSGALTANINVVLPAWVKEWEIVNNCTGSFSVTVKTPSGSGVSIAPGSSTPVLGDGVNITQSYSSGALLAVRTFYASTPYIKTPGTRKTRWRAIGAGGGGGGAGATGSGQFSAGGGGIAGSYAETPLIDPPADNTPITVGSKGKGGAAGANAGTSGGTTTVGGVISSPGGGGGLGGSASPYSNIVAQIGNPANTPTGNILVYARGAPAASVTGFSTGLIKGGDGGASFFGIGGAGGQSVTSSSPSPALNYGSAGGGAALGQNGSAVAGADGADGLVIVEEYA